MHATHHVSLYLEKLSDTWPQSLTDPVVTPFFLPRHTLLGCAGCARLILVCMFCVYLCHHTHFASNSAEQNTPNPVPATVHSLAAQSLVGHACCQHLAASACLRGNLPASCWLKLVAEQGAGGGCLHQLDAFDEPAAQQGPGLSRRAEFGV